MANLTKTVLTFDDGSTQEFDVAVTAPTGVPVAEVAKVEAEVAAVDAELKTDVTA